MIVHAPPPASVTVRPVSPAGMVASSPTAVAVPGPRFSPVTVHVPLCPATRLPLVSVVLVARSAAGLTAIPATFEAEVTVVAPSGSWKVAVASSSSCEPARAAGTFTWYDRLRLSPIGRLPPAPVVAPVPVRTRTVRAAASYSPVSSAPVSETAVLVAPLIDFSEPAT